MTVLPYLLPLFSLMGASGAPPAVHSATLHSPYQPEPVPIEVITPEVLEPGRRYPVLYILPVESGITSRWGSGMREAVKADVANRYQVICVAPAFTATPWFADHPTDPALQQESHFLKVVLPWVEANYPAEPTGAGRLLLGFSKSGYGAVMLLLRHPGLFDRALAWDAPLGKTAPDQFRMIEVFGTPEHFHQYAIPNLLRERAAELRTGPPRIFLMPDEEGDHPMENVRSQLEELDIPHVVEYTTGYKHHWESGWFLRAVELLFGSSVAP